MGVAAEGDALADTVQRLLLRSDPHLVTGVIGAGAAPLVHTLFRDARTPFIVNGLGGDPLLLGDESNPWVFWNSFNVWKSTYALGYWAARNLGDTTALAVGFHGAGYAMIQAFWNGFQEAGGGTILATQVTHPESADDDPTPQIRALLDEEPDFIAGFYSGREGVSFLDAYRDPDVGGDLPLVVSPFTLHDPWLHDMGSDAVGLRTAYSGNVGAHPELEEDFVRAYGDKSDDPPGVFGILGYEAGQMIGDALETLDGAVAGGEDLREAFVGSAPASPRGRRRVDPDSGDVETVEYLLEVEAGPGGASRVVVDGPLALPDRYDEDLAAFRRQPRKNGWLNPYLVT